MLSHRTQKHFLIVCFQLYLSQNDYAQCLAASKSWRYVFWSLDLCSSSTLFIIESELKYFVTKIALGFKFYAMGLTSRTFTNLDTKSIVW